MNNKVCIVTGASDGIGLETALGLARLGAHVVMTARNPAKGEAARQSILRQVPEARIDLLLADFASLDAVRGLAAQILAAYPRIDVLINNAGVFLGKRALSVDGFEMTFAVNHLAPFLLTNLLLERLRQSNARIINVASTAHKGAKIDFDDLQHERRYSLMPVYGQSKLANILFTRELARRLAGSGTTANCLHPGVISTNLVSGYWPARLAWAILRPFLLTPAQGARTSIYLASSPEVATTSGEYFDKCKPVSTTAEGKDMAMAARLWSVSEKMVGLTN